VKQRAHRLEVQRAWKYENPRESSELSRGDANLRWSRPPSLRHDAQPASLSSAPARPNREANDHVRG
jgi:hypothetical protein